MIFATALFTAAAVFVLGFAAGHAAARGDGRRPLTGKRLRTLKARVAKLAAGDTS